MSPREPIDPSRHFRFAPDTDWDELRAQYRLLVQRWHPDRHPLETRAEAQAEFIEIVAAFKGLRRHYGEHGCLPGPVPRVTAPPAPATTGSGENALDGTLPGAAALRVRAILRAPLTAALAALCLALSLTALVLFLDERLERERREQAFTHAVESGERTLRKE